MVQAITIASAASAPLSDDAKWAAVSGNDAAFDGRFFYGVATTDIFCRPSCRSRTPRRENVVYFGSAAEAVARGFRPCRKCRPDLEGPAPGRELAARARELIRQAFGETNPSDAEARGARRNPEAMAGDALPTPEALAHALGVDPGHLSRAFKAAFGQSLHQHLARLKVRRAMELLRETGRPVAGIALECGFESLSNFYKRFRELAGTSPGNFRKARRSGPEKPSFETQPAASPGE